jgi:Holliday junction resolvase RusA-like endonuclease
MSVAFVVYGEAQQAGSKRIVASGRSGGRVHLTDDNPKAKEWMRAVAAAAGIARNGADGLLDGPLRLVVSFYVVRGKGHFGTGRNAGRLVPSAPRWPTKRPDATKLVRAVEDALTGVVWRDDSQVVVQEIEKVYGEPARCEIRVEEIPW